MFETFEHKADIGVRGSGATMEEAFADCAKAMFSVMCDLEKVEGKEKVEVEAEANDVEALLVEFLNELLYLKDVNNRLYSKFDLYITRARGGFELKGKAEGERIDKRKHALKTEVKAASYHQLKVAKEGKNWVAQCVVDV